MLMINIQIEEQMLSLYDDGNVHRLCYETIASILP